MVNMPKSEVIRILKSLNLENVKKLLETPPQPDFGDLAFPCFELAKKEKRSPKEIAEEIAKKIKITKDSLLSKVKAKAAYVNFFFDWEKISGITLKEILTKKENYGKPEKIESKKIMVEFSQPNPIGCEAINCLYVMGK